MNRDQNRKALLSKKEQKQIAMESNVLLTTLSFYKYVQIGDPAGMQKALKAELSRLGCNGRLYVAHEGINAQMNVPKAHFDELDVYIHSIPEFSDVPLKIAVEEGHVPSFYKLTIKVKEKIVADGLDDETFDVTNTGEYLTAREMNEYVEDPNAVVVDMRNAYESEIGHFEDAITPDVDTFRDELKVVPELLKVHKNKKIALYCTGGIRCEKASAWLKHNGFKQVRHLKGGIIEYRHQIEKEGLMNKFKGKNFVFDERMGERIGGEIISTCHLCGVNKSDTHYHCKNQACHILFLGCDSCIQRRYGYCSLKCRLFDTLPQKLKKFVIRNNYKNKPAQFKKHRLKPKKL